MKKAKSSRIFLDGQFVAAGPALTQLLSPGVLAGEGVFETMLVRKGKVCFMAEHLRRLQNGLRCLKIRPPYSSGEYIGFFERALKSNRLRNARLRLMVWRNQHKTHACIQAGAYHPPLATQYRRGYRVIVSTLRGNKNSLWSNIKSIRYESFLKAYARAQRHGCDEALVLNRRGELVEGSRTNIFWIKDKTLHTPSLSCGGLNGIIRQVVLAIAGRLQLKIRQGRFPLARLQAADEAFLTNSLIGIMPLTFCGGRAIGSGRAGPATKSFQREYQQGFR